MLRSSRWRVSPTWTNRGSTFQDPSEALFRLCQPRKETKHDLQHCFASYVYKYVIIRTPFQNSSTRQDFCTEFCNTQRFFRGEGNSNLNESILISREKHCDWMRLKYSASNYYCFKKLEKHEVKYVPPLPLVVQNKKWKIFSHHLSCTWLMNHTARKQNCKRARASRAGEGCRGRSPESSRETSWG